MFKPAPAHIFVSKFLSFHQDGTKLDNVHATNVIFSNFNSPPPLT